MLPNARAHHASIPFCQELRHSSRGALNPSQAVERHGPCNWSLCWLAANLVVAIGIVMMAVILIVEDDVFTRDMAEMMIQDGVTKHF